MVLSLTMFILSQQSSLMTQIGFAEFDDAQCNDPILPKPMCGRQVARGCADCSRRAQGMLLCALYVTKCSRHERVQIGPYLGAVTGQLLCLSSLPHADY